VAALAFCPGKNFISQSNLWAKTRAEHGSVATEEPQTLISKKINLFNQKQHCKILCRTQVKYQIAIFAMQAVLSLFRFCGKEESPGNIEHPAS